MLLVHYTGDKVNSLILDPLKNSLSTSSKVENSLVGKLTLALTDELLIDVTLTFKFFTRVAIKDLLLIISRALTLEALAIVIVLPKIPLLPIFTSTVNPKLLSALIEPDDNLSKSAANLR